MTTVFTIPCYRPFGAWSRPPPLSPACPTAGPDQPYGRCSPARWPRRRGVETDLAAARAALDPDAFDAAWVEGAALSLEEAVAYGSRGRGERNVRRRDGRVSPRLSEEAIAHASRGRGERKRPSAGWASLTPAEVEVVRLVSDGLRNADIAAKLFFSQATVKTHLSHVFAKLGVSARAELAAMAARRTTNV